MRIGVITLTLAFSMALAFLVVGAFPPQSGAGPCDDPDSDSICAPIDNCSDKANTAQTDTDVAQDGYGNLCDADYDENNIVGFTDLAALRAAWQATATDTNYNPDCDSEPNNVIGFTDLALLRAQWQGGPGPSGMSCAGSQPCP